MDILLVLAWEVFLKSVLADARWIAPHGIGRFAREILDRLPQIERLVGGPKLLSPLEPFWLSAQIAAQRPRAYFSPGFNPPAWSASPYVFTIHDLIHLHFAEERSRSKALYYELLVRRAARKAARVLTVSEFSKAQILEWAGLREEQVSVVGNGVSEAFGSEGTRYSPGYPYIFSVLNTKPHKNLPTLLKAFSISSAREDHHLVLRLTPNPTIFAMLESLHIQHKVHFVGVLSDQELATYYRGASLFVLPSLYEGFGLPPVEAMACGTPVVVSNLTSLPEVVGDAALLVDPTQPEAIAMAIEQVLGDPIMHSQLSERGVKQARQYNWETTTAKTWAVLHRIL